MLFICASLCIYAAKYKLHVIEASAALLLLQILFRIVNYCYFRIFSIFTFYTCIYALAFCHINAVGDKYAY